LKNWWQTYQDRRVRYAVMYGGVAMPKATNSYHKIYVRKYKYGAFPNRGRVHWNVAQGGTTRQRPININWPYDITSMIFNQARMRADRIGYVVSTNMLKTAVVACQHLVYYPKFNQRVARSQRVFAHDEDLACVDGDLVHIKLCRRISKYKKYYVFSILEPNIEARERLKLGLKAVPPPLFGRPTSARVVKLNLGTSEGTKQRLASALQEQVQSFYDFAGRPTAKTSETEQLTFNDASKLVAANQAETPVIGGSNAGHIAEGAEFTEEVKDERAVKGEEFWAKKQPQERYDFKNFTQPS
jgi:small subunit ribosomal protein S17